MEATPSSTLVNESVSSPPRRPRMNADAFRNLGSSYRESQEKVKIELSLHLDQLETFENFSQEIYGDPNALTDQDITRHPSLLTMFVPSPHSVVSEGVQLRDYMSPKKTSLSNILPTSATKSLHLEARGKSNFSKLQIVDESLAVVSSDSSVPPYLSLSGPTLATPLSTSSSLSKTFSASLIELGVDIVDDGDYDVDDDDGATLGPTIDVNAESDPLQEGGISPTFEKDSSDPIPSSFNVDDEQKSLSKTSSFALSMSDWAFRREEVLRKVAAGELISHRPAEELLDPSLLPHITVQVNIDLYSDENQARRRRVKKNPQFVAIMKRFWDCIDLLKDPTNTFFSKESYKLMCGKIARLIIPPPYDQKAVEMQAESDWSPDTNGTEKMGYNEFFKCIFQVVDNWTETCNVEQYVSDYFIVVLLLFFHALRLLK